MEREVVEGPGVPAKIGPYSQAVRAGGFVFVSGQPGVDPETGEPAGPLFSEQARQAFSNLDAVLRAGGSRPELVVSTTVLVADQASFPELNELYAEFPAFLGEASVVQVVAGSVATARALIWNLSRFEQRRGIDQLSCSCLREIC